ncbi:MAG TPA: alpha/beta hydrolase, partial [Roseimicrobium sp.]|nr:alpha/beta hydrolase [Roseimicrobium sp.]
MNNRQLLTYTTSLLLAVQMVASAQPAPKANPSQTQQPKQLPTLRIPDGVKAHRDIAYVERGHERHKLDLYVPEKSDGPLPLIIWIHGGGWQNGSKDGCPPLRQGFTERGYAVASINYRLSGHAVFPAQIEDCKSAIRWLRAHAKQYNLNPDRFGVWG